jgi:hypothetical protein
VAWREPVLPPVVAAGAVARLRSLSSWRPDVSPTSLGFTDLLVGRFGSDVGGPWWLGALLVVLAVLALIPRATRIPVLVAGWSRRSPRSPPALSSSRSRSTAVGAARHRGDARGPARCFVLAAMLGAQGSSRSCALAAEHHQVLLGVLAVVAAIILAIGLGWFVWQGPGDLASSEDTGIPAYMTDARPPPRPTDPGDPR